MADEVRPTQGRDWELVDGGRPPFLCISLTLLRDGEPVAIAGVRYDPAGAFTFSNIRPGVSLSPVTVYRGARRVLKMLQEQGIKRILALVNEGDTGAGRLHKMLGFTYLYDTVDRTTGQKLEIYRWQRHFN